MTYLKKLTNPKWQERRLRIMERDEFKCRVCGENTSMLHVHHIAYIDNMDPWEYEDKSLITLCEGHHKMAHAIIDGSRSNSKIINEGIINVLDFIQACPWSIMVFCHIENHKGIWNLVSSVPGWLDEKLEVVSNLCYFINGVDCNVYMDYSDTNLFDIIKPIGNKRAIL